MNASPVGGAACARNAVSIVGDGARTILFAHGFGVDQRTWAQQVPPLAERYRVVLFDHVGAGRSDLDAYSARKYRSLRAYASDLLEVMEELGLERAYYVGHSMGAMIGLLAAIEHPPAFEKLIFVGASPRYVDDPATGYVGGFTQLEIDALLDAIATNFQAWAAGFAPVAMGNPGRPELATQFFSTLSQMRPDIALGVARIVFTSDHRADVPRLAAPTLLVQSTNDAAVPHAVADYLASHLPDAQLITVPSEGHFPHLAAPEVVTDAIRTYFG